MVLRQESFTRPARLLDMLRAVDPCNPADDRTRMEPVLETGIDKPAGRYRLVVELDE